jgi:D-alanyl-lipoteichoic acid acyltransferase DltB (MBOAT superfamily)
MIDPVAFLLMILLAAGLSRLAFATAPANRLFWCCAPGAGLFFIVDPAALGFAVVCLVAVSALYGLGRRSASARVRARLPYLHLLLLFAPDGLNVFAANPILWLGSAFFIVRQMMTVADALKSRRTAGDTSVGLLLATFCFPALPSGPVFNGLVLRDQLQERRPAAPGEGLYRLVEGFAYLFVFAGFAQLALTYGERQADALWMGGAPALSWSVYLLAVPLAGFAFLFASFYGYSRIAEGSAMLFGMQVPENFNKPHLARDLSDFWMRWHRSMASFVMQHIYLPLLVSTRHPKLALVSAFAFMGAWHEFSLAFLVWGVGHGLGLAYLMPLAKRIRTPAPALRAFTLTYVLALSSVAHGVWP